MLNPARGTFDHSCHKGRLVSEPGLTKELRTRAGEHITAKARRRRIVGFTVTVAVVAVCAYLLLRWLA